jgi:hypothetical protein
VLANGQTLGTRIPGIFGPDVDAQKPADSSKQ